MTAIEMKEVRKNPVKAIKMISLEMRKERSKTISERDNYQRVNREKMMVIRIQKVKKNKNEIRERWQLLKCKKGEKIKPVVKEVS